MSSSDDRGFAEDAGHEFSQHAGRGYFASDRPGGFGGFDIWYVTWNETLQRWENPTNCGADVNSAANEVDPAPAIGGSLLYLASDRAGGAGGYDLYVVHQDDVAGFDSLSALTGLNTPADETGPCETSSAMFFASNRPGGIGGMDLYRAAIDSTNNAAWNAPSNLGSSVNTTANETDPAVSVGSTPTNASLLFASNRSGGPGGYDIYAARETSGVWQPAFLVPAPISTAMNETGPSLSMASTAIYWATDQPSGHGGWDVFSARNVRERPKVLWDGDAQTAPGTSTPLDFDVVNDGPLPVQILPQLYNNQGWTLHWNNTPFQLQPGELRRFPLTVDVPASAPLGSFARVFMTAVANFQVPDQDSARVFSGGPLAVPPAAPGNGRLELRAQPNPYAREVLLGIGVPVAAQARIEIFDIAGRRVRALYSGPLPAGLRMLRWDGRDDSGAPVRSGMHFCRAVVGNQRATLLLIARR